MLLLSKSDVNVNLMQSGQRQDLPVLFDSLFSHG